MLVSCQDSVGWRTDQATNKTNRNELDREKKNCLKDPKAKNGVL